MRDLPVVDDPAVDHTADDHPLDHELISGAGATPHWPCASAAALPSRDNHLTLAYLFDDSGFPIVGCRQEHLRHTTGSVYVDLVAVGTPVDVRRRIRPFECIQIAVRDDLLEPHPSNRLVRFDRHLHLQRCLTSSPAWPCARAELAVLNLRPRLPRLDGQRVLEVVFLQFSTARHGPGSTGGVA